MNIEQAKADLIETLESIDKGKLSLPDLKLYAEVLKIVSDIQEKSYYEIMKETLSGFGGAPYKPATISEMKG